MMILPVVSGVSQQHGKGLSSMGLAYHLAELHIVGLGSAVDHHAEEQVALDLNNR